MKRLLLPLLAALILFFSSGCEVAGQSEAVSPSPSSAPVSQAPYARGAVLSMADGTSCDIDPNTLTALTRDVEGDGVSSISNSLTAFEGTVDFSNNDSITYKLRADLSKAMCWVEADGIWFPLSGEASSQLLQNGLFDALYIKNVSLVSAYFGEQELPLTRYEIPTPAGHTVIKATETSPAEVYVEEMADFVPTFNEEPSTLEVLILDREGAVPEELIPGEYTCKIEAGFIMEQWECRLTYSSTLHILGMPEIILSAAQAAQGQLITAVIDGAVDYAKYSLYLSHLDSTFPCFAVQDSGGSSVTMGIIQLNITAPLGGQTASLYREKQGGAPEKVAEIAYTVTETEFVRQDLQTSSETQSLFTNSNLNNDNERANAARAKGVDTPYFSGLFIRPVDGTITTQFGQTRYVNGNFQSRHTGLDIAAAEGVSVQAAARGRVVFADDFIVNGKTVIIDHGAGIFTAYSHMSAITVEDDDMIEQGAEIGLVGSTGYSTGPHLHYTVMINGYYVSPEYVEQTEILGGYIATDIDEN